MKDIHCVLQRCIQPSNRDKKAVQTSEKEENTFFIRDDRKD